jgi:hypothetical protein
MVQRGRVAEIGQEASDGRPRRCFAERVRRDFREAVFFCA